MTTPGPPHGFDQRIYPMSPSNPLFAPGSPPPAGWSTLPVADRLIQALERLVDLNQEAGQLTAIHRASLQRQEARSHRDMEAQQPTTREDDRDRDEPRDERELDPLATARREGAATRRPGSADGSR